MQHLIYLKRHLVKTLTSQSHDKLELLIVNGELPSGGALTYTARFLIIDYRDNALKPIMAVRHWLDKHGYTDVGISFDSEVINDETFDLEIDISLTDKVVSNANDGSFHVCPPKVWDDETASYKPIVFETADTIQT